MTDYPQYPNDPTTRPPVRRTAAPAGRDRDRPRSTSAVKLIWAAIAVSLISAARHLHHDRLDHRRPARGGRRLEAINADTVRSAVLVGAIFGLVISVAIYALLAIFIGKGANWARIVFTVFTVIGVAGSVFGLGSQPLVLLFLTVIGLICNVAAVVFLFRADASAWFKAR